MTLDIQTGDLVRLRKNPARPSRYDGLEWEVIKTGGYGTLTLRLVGGTAGQTCGATLEAVESTHRPTK